MHQRHCPFQKHSALDEERLSPKCSAKELVLFRKIKFLGRRLLTLKLQEGRRVYFTTLCGFTTPLWF